MSWIGLFALVIGLYLAFKVASAVLKIVLFVVALAVGYWFAAPALGLPSVSDLFYVLGPDFGGRRIEDLARPEAIAEHVAREVVDGVAERAASALPAMDSGENREAQVPSASGTDVPPASDGTFPEPRPAPRVSGEDAVGAP